ncbi:MAG: response regulator [Limisphaerales bacterium]
MKSSLRILNLEDNVNDAELNAAMISARWPHCHFVRVDTRGDFFAALEQSDLDIILSDYTMPNFSGREALALAREKRPDVPFLFVSGTIGEDTAIEALKNGATDYVLKHRLMRLIPAVARALSESEERAERERAEEAMRQSEHKYRELFECLDDAAFLVDEKSGRIIDTNHAAEKITGCARGEIVGQNQSKFLAPGTSSPPDGEIALAGTNKTPLPCALIRSNKTVLLVNAHGTRLVLYGQPLVLWLCRKTNS